MVKINQNYNKLLKLYAFVAALVLIIFLLAAWYADLQRDRHFQARLVDLQLIQQTKQSFLLQETEQQLEIAVKLIGADKQLNQLLLSAALQYQQLGSAAELTSLRDQTFVILYGYWQKLQPYGASQLHLHLAPNAFTFLRAHRPERHSDVLDSIRPLVMHSIINAEPVTGTELGRHGLGLRSVIPVRDNNNNVMAAIELGFDLQSVFNTRPQHFKAGQPSADNALQDIALLIKPDSAALLHNDLKAGWFHSVFWSSPRQHDMLQFWLDNQLIPEYVSEPLHLTLSFNQRTFLVSLLPWPVWGQSAQQHGALISASWQDITEQLDAQQHTAKLIWFIWVFSCLITLLLCLLLVAFIQRQARQEVSQQQTLLTQSEQKLSALYQLSPLPILLNRFSDGAFVESNPAMTTLTGYSIDEIKQLSYWDLTPESYAEAEQQQLKLLTETGRYGPYVKHYKHKNGGLIDIELNGVLFNDGQGESYIWTIIQDISEIKRIEKLKDDFVSTVSHELRTPLTSIAGSLGLVLGGAGGVLSPKAEKLLSIAHKNSQRLNVLINDLLDIDKLMAGKMRFDEALALLPNLLQDAVEQNQPYARQHDIKLTLVNAPQVQLFVDAARIQQVLANFLSNAIKFSPANTEVLLNAEIIANHVRISVQDQGPGIAAVDQHRLFQRFSQLEQNTSQVKSGTGLGLAISREIVMQSGGDVGVISEPGQGATFWLKLPLYRALLPASSPDAILIIEDDTDTAHLLSEFLTSSHYETDWAPDSQTAWQRLSERKYAAITLDLKLQNESGADFFLRLRDNVATAHIPVLIVSAYVEQGKLQLAALANAIDWIEKPVSPEILNLKLAQLLSQLPQLERFHRILHIEDDSDIITIMRMQLEQQCEYLPVMSISEAKAILTEQKFELILLDLGLPDGNGISLLSTIANTQGDIPVVIFSAQDVSIENKLKVKAVFSKSKMNTELLAKYLSKLLNSDNEVNQ